MKASARLRGAVSLAAVALFTVACASPQPKAMVNKKPRSKEYFAESEYGVKASPRVTNARSNLPRGGGRDQVGKPYKVRGKMYYPKEEKDYRKTGLASWYGDAFHGRLTANGEVYDMTHLTAAHPTMPLPSYARVTNLENGNSVIVRVNDRGPYAHNRLIDLSSRAADMLDYKRNGTAKVQVEYVGRAPLHGQDDSYLMASYRPGNRAPDPSDGLPTGVMIAMNGPTPSGDVGRSAVAFPGAMTDTVAAAGLGMLSDAALPTFGPIAPERPDPFLDGGTQIAMAALGYAPSPSAQDRDPFAVLDRALTPDAVIASWQRMNPGGKAANPEAFVAAGSFRSAAEAEALARRLSAFGRTGLEVSAVGGVDWYDVTLTPDGRGDLYSLLEAAWNNGAPDAIAVRD